MDALLVFSLCCLLDRIITDDNFPYINSRSQFRFPQAGNYLRDDTVSSTLQIVSSAAPERQAYAAMRLWTSLERSAVSGDATEKQPLVQVYLIYINFNLSEIFMG